MSQSTTTPAVYRELLLERSTVTDFLHAAYEFLASTKHSFSYAQFSKMAGFKARSYGRALVLGLKPVSLNAYFQLVKLFKFDKEHAEYFKLLIALDHEGFFDLPEDQKVISERMEKLKYRILRRQNASENVEKNVGAFSSRDHLVVYASLTDTEEGLPFQKIVKKTGMTDRVCRAILDDLVEKELAKKVFKYDSYRCVDSFLVGQKLGGREAFINAWCDSAKMLVEKSSTHMNSETTLFLNSYLSIRKEKLNQFKVDLRDLCEKYLDHWCQETGDELVEVIVGATPIKS